MDAGMTCRKCGSDMCGSQRMWPVRTRRWVEELVNVQQKCGKLNTLTVPCRFNRMSNMYCVWNTDIQPYMPGSSGLEAKRKRSNKVITIQTKKCTQLY
jgi:hypothetical protein